MPPLCLNIGPCQLNHRFMKFGSSSTIKFVNFFLLFSQVYPLGKRINLYFHQGLSLVTKRMFNNYGYFGKEIIYTIENVKDVP